MAATNTDPTPISAAVESSSPRQYAIDDFATLRSIRRGSYGTLLQVKLRGTDSVFAMKVIEKASFVIGAADWELFAHRMRALVAQHPFVVHSHSSFQSPSRFFFVMEYVGGENLLSVTQRCAPLPEDEVRFYAAEIVLALKYMHEHQLILADLMPQYVLIDYEGHIKLTCHGLFKHAVRPCHVAATLYGSVKYMAPELLREEGFGSYVDWWALAVILYEMLVGRHPFAMIGQEAADTSEYRTAKEALLKSITQGRLFIPNSLTWKARAILVDMLNPNRIRRLGFLTRVSIFHDISTHPFFSCTNWDKLIAKEVSAPFKPITKYQNDAYAVAEDASPLEYGEDGIEQASSGSDDQAVDIQEESYMDIVDDESFLEAIDNLKNELDTGSGSSDS